MQQAELQIETASALIAGASPISTSGSNPDVVDFSAEMLALISGQTAFSANVAALETSDQMQQNLLDVTA